MPTSDALLLAALIFAAAVLYSSVGHAGASGYLAAMALFGLAPEVMKPTALALNILVATIGTLRFYRAGYVSWRTLWPFVVGSIPLAFVGGALHLPGSLYKQIVGLILLFAAARLAWPSRAPAGHPAKGASPVPVLPAAGTGAAIGLLAGLTGTGGGIFLSPVLLLARWTDVRGAAGTAAPFILVNSLAGLAGNVASVRSLPETLPLWAAAAVAGSLVGTELGTKRLRIGVLQRVLAVVLVIAGLKLILA
ncbi:MAG: sulfite exporter TauE/SafE family protein [Chloroflexi bacterium]|nr:sulfite exporter TauE/SafE family protein [Chloroflexota bacterium]